MNSSHDAPPAEAKRGGWPGALADWSAKAMAAVPGLRRHPRAAWFRPLPLRRWAESDPRQTLQVIERAQPGRFALPCNVASRDELPGLLPPVVKNLGLRDVPDLEIGASYRAEVHDCFLLRTRFPWGGSDFCLCTPEGRPLQFHGLISDPGDRPMRALQRRALRGEHEELDGGTWIVGHWYNNYYHWFVEWLPRALVALDQGIDPDTLLMPPPMGAWAHDSLRALGLRPRILPEEGEAWRVRRLTLIHESPFRASTLRALAQRLRAQVGPLPPRSRKVWISRRGAVHRRLLQEAVLESWLAARGWEIVRLEELSLAEQIRLLGSCVALAGLHGAGLTNMIFAPPGTAVLEIVMRERPCSEYYGLGAALGHPYWIVMAHRAGNRESLVHDDVNVDLAAFQRAIEQLEQTTAVHPSEKVFR
jgi:hypothetical protein